MTKRRPGKSYTPEQLEQTREEMLRVPYEVIKAEFLRAIAESQEKPRRKPRRLS